MTPIHLTNRQSIFNHSIFQNIQFTLDNFLTLVEDVRMLLKIWRVYIEYLSENSECVAFGGFWWEGCSKV